jgi:hypothetical protein
VAEIIANAAEPDGLGAWEGYADTAREIIAALSPTEAPAPATGGMVRVKALEWDRESPTEWTPETWKAQSLVGEYDIQREKDGRFSGFAPNAGTDLFGTLNEARAAAQADYEARISASLATDASPSGESA